LIIFSTVFKIISNGFENQQKKSLKTAFKEIDMSYGLRNKSKQTRKNFKITDTTIIQKGKNNNNGSKHFDNMYHIKIRKI